MHLWGFVHLGASQHAVYFHKILESETVMTRRFLLSVGAIGMLLGMAASVDATKLTPPMTGGDQINGLVANFPQPAPGMRQFVITLPAELNEADRRVGIMAGRMVETDGVNRVGIAGQLSVKTLQGFGYKYFEVEGGDGPSLTTLIGVPPGTPKVVQFISLQEMLVPYNSRVPLVIYAPENFEVRYRVFAAGLQQVAPKGPAGKVMTPPVRSGKNTVRLSASLKAQLPQGSTATISLYDSMLMDADSTWAKHTIAIDRLPAQLPMPEGKRPKYIAGPAVSVAIRDAAGQLLYINDFATPINESGPTNLKMRRAN